MTSDTAREDRAILFENVRIFDGTGDAYREERHLLAAGGRIEEISGKPIRAPRAAMRIDGRDRVLMPGLIDCHWHALLSAPFERLMTTTPLYAGVAAGRALEATLLRGFTTVRDTGGADFGLLQAIEDGLVRGPRIYPSGRALSQTGGHGDFRLPHEPHPGHDAARHADSVKAAAIALVDGADAVLRAAREELRRGATQIKILAGGGVISPSDPIHSVQFSPDEVRAAVEAASSWDTYVCAHAYTPAAIRRCVENGVRCIEHANLIDEPTARLVKERNVFVVPNLVTYWAMERNPVGPPAAREKNRMVFEATRRELELLRAHEIGVAFGTDLVGPAHVLQNREFGLRREVFSNAEILRQATSNGGRLVARCGRLNAHGKLGVIEPGAAADLLLVDGDPLADLGVMEEPEKRFAVIVRDGVPIRNRPD